ncbi:MAG: endolytic transglycosylase MltG [Neisseriaceae bacterium]
MRVNVSWKVVAGASLVLLSTILAILLYWPRYFSAGTYRLEVSPGAGVASVGNQLKRAGVIQSVWGFRLLSKLQGLERSLRPGFFYFKSPISLWQVEAVLGQPPKRVTLTFIEGWSYGQVKQLIDTHPGIKHTTLNWSEAELLNSIAKGKDYHSMEGLLSPDSFYFYEGTPDRQVYQKAYELMQKELQQAWESRDKDLPYHTPYELLIMASLIEKETANAEDRPLVAAVLVNRLKKGTRLQTDPTVIYGAGKSFQAPITQTDLKMNNQYNTYTRIGLPPTPIANPSRASLQAAAHPAPVDYNYFVSRGDHSGKSQFSRSLAEHLEAVKAYRIRKLMGAEIRE